MEFLNKGSDFTFKHDQRKRENHLYGVFNTLKARG